MKPLSLNLSQMTKVAGDKHSSTFRHQKGHEIKVAHSAIPPLYRKQVMELPVVEQESKKEPEKPKDKKAEVREDKGYGKIVFVGAEGGKVEAEHEHDPYPEKATDEQHKAWLERAKKRNDALHRLFMANHEKIMKMVRGGMVESNSTADKSESYQEKMAGLKQGATEDKSVGDKLKDGFSNIKKALSGEEYAKGGTVKQYADGSPDEPVAEDDAAPKIEINNAPPPSQPPPAVEAAKPPAQGVRPISGEEQQINPAVTMANSDPMAGVAIPKVPDAVPNLNPDGTMNPAAIAKNSQAAVEATSQLEQAQGRAAANRIAGFNQGNAQVNQDIQNKTQFLAMHVNQYANFLNENPPNPNHYMESMSTGKKVRTAIGLFLGGLGGGIAGTGGNAALDYLKFQIQNDIDGQKQRADQQKTIYGAYRHLYGAGIAADASTKATMLDIYNQQVQQAAGLMATPGSQARALKFGADVAIEKSKLLQDAAVSLPSLPGTRPVGGGGGAMAPSQPSDKQAQQKPLSGDQQAKPGAVKEEKKSILGGDSKNNSQLMPNSGSRLQQLQKFDIFAKNPKRADELQQAHDQQTKTDEMLAKVDKLYDSMYSQTNGISGRIHRGVNPHAIAAGAGAIGTGAGAVGGALLGAGVGAIPGAVGGGSIGAGIGEGIGHALQAITNTDANAQYDTDFETLRGIISASLPGRGDQFVEEAARKYAVTDRDSEEGARKKREALKEYIVDHQSNGILKQYKILK